MSPPLTIASVHHEPIELTRGSKMNPAIQVSALLWVAAALAPAHAAESYANWDNFDGATAINPTLWLAPERSRMIEGGALRFVQRDRGSQVDNTGLFSNSWTSRFANPAAVNRMKATVTVNGFDLTGCASNTTPSSVLARINGQFFNAGPGVPTNSINNIGATIELRRSSNSVDAPGVLRVEGSVYQCTTADCNYGASGLGNVDLGTALIGEAVTLRLDWDAAGNRFGFARGSDPAIYVNYGVSDALAPYGAFRQIGTRTQMANCLAGARTEGLIDAKFDNVTVNASAVP